MTVAQTALTMPFRRVLVMANGNHSFAGGYNTLEEAQKATEASNNQAVDMGLSATYKAIPKP